MIDNHEILEFLAGRRDELPRWAHDLLDPYVRLQEARHAAVTATTNASNACAMSTSPRKADPMKLGTSVVFGRHQSHGENEHAAIVTRVWAEDDSHPTVNLKVFPDCGDPFDATSVQYWKNAGWGSSYYYREA